MKTTQFLVTTLLTLSFANTTFANDDISSAAKIIAQDNLNSLVKFSPSDSKKIFQRLQFKASDIIGKPISYKGNPEAFCLREKAQFPSKSKFSCYMSRDSIKEVFSNSDEKNLSKESPTNSIFIESVVLDRDYYSQYQGEPTHNEQTSGDIFEILEDSSEYRLRENTGYAETQFVYGNQDAECRAVVHEEHGYNRGITCGFNFHSMQDIFAHEERDAINMRLFDLQAKIKNSYPLKKTMPRNSFSK